MSRKLRITSLGVLPVAAVCAMASLAPDAYAQKGVLGTGADPSTGIVDPDGGFRYTAVTAGAGTLIAKLDTDDGSLVRSTYADGRLAVPAVANDGSASGLSADGETLVLHQPGVRFPQTRSQFSVLDTRRLRTLRTVELEGTFTFDALSPDGRSLYLIEYTSPRDLTEYLVRRYDLRRGRLDPSPIIDPNESGEDMYGTPWTRATSPDGRWAYTLYDGEEYPFIHALDTQRATAVCIDLEFLDGYRHIWRADLVPSPDGDSLGVVDRGEPLASVDLASFAAGRPAPERAAGESTTGESETDGNAVAAWALGGGAAAALLALIAVWLPRRRRRIEERTGDELERLIRVEGESDQEDSREREQVR